MTKRLVLSVLFSLVASAASGEPAKVMWDGAGTGGIGVPGAEIRHGELSAGAHGSYLSQGGLAEPGDDVTRLRYGLGVLYAPISHLEVGASLAGSRVTSSLSTSESLTNFGDWTLAAKGAYPVNEWYSTGVRARLLLLSGIEGESGFGDTSSYAGEWVNTARWGELALHGTVGYLYDRTVNFTSREPTSLERFSWGQIDFNQLIYGLSANYETGFADYTLELRGNAAIGDDAPSVGQSPLRFTPGVRLRPWSKLEIQFAADLSLADWDSAVHQASGIPPQPGYDLLWALRWHFDEGEPWQRDEAAAKPVERVEAPEPVPAPEEAFEEAPEDDLGEFIPPDDVGPLMPEPVTSPEAAVEPPAEARAPTGSVAGRVISLATGEPIKGARVRVEGTDVSGRTAPSGNYLLNEVPEGKHKLTVEAEGMRDATAEADVKIDGLTTVDIGLRLMPTTGTLRVRVRSETGQVIAGAEVSVDGRKAGETNAEGVFKAEGVKPGDHRISVSKEGFKPVEPKPAIVEAGETGEAAFLLERRPRPGFVEVKAMNIDREPVAATVTIEGEPQETRELKPSAGSTALYRLEPGKYRIRVEAEGYKPDVQAVEVESDGEYALRFKLEK